MGKDFESYLQQLQLIGFFSGYPLIFALVFVISGPPEKRNEFRKKLVQLLPLSYALVGILFLGFIAQNYDRSFWRGFFTLRNNQTFLVFWGTLAIFFWLPLFNKKIWMSLVHSLVFFGLFAKELFFHPRTDDSRLSNNMKLYTDSLILQAACFLAIFLAYNLFSFFRKKLKP